MIQNKALWIFPNIKESVDVLPKRLRGQAWEMIINYAFGDENVEQSCKNIKVLLAFRVVKPLLRLRGIAGSQNGKSNNPSGLAKNKEPNIAPNITPNITPNPYITETITETITEIEKENKKEKNKLLCYGEFKNVCLTEEDYNRLQDKYGKDELSFAIEKLDGWLDKDKQKKKRNQNHRAYFKQGSWVFDKKEHTQKTLFTGVESGTYGKDIPL